MKQFNNYEYISLLYKKYVLRALYFVLSVASIYSARLRLRARRLVVTLFLARLHTTAFVQSTLPFHSI